MPVPRGAVTKEALGPAGLAIGLFLLLWLPAAIFSQGFPEADGCTHYLCSRFAFQLPGNFVDMWGRPVCTALFAVPALVGGRLGVCFTSALLGIGCSIIAYELARDQGDRRPVLALIFTLAQPILFVHSLSSMTELPFALLLGAAFLAFTRNKWGIAAILASLFPLTRPEGFGFLLIAAGALLWRRKAQWWIVLPLPLLAWDLVGWMIRGEQGPWWHWLISQWPWSSHSMYLPGDPLTFVAQLPAVVSPLVIPATLLGIWQSLKKPGRFRVTSAMIPLFVLSVHTLLYASGKLGSYGEVRYMLIAAPFWAVLSGRGWEWCFNRLEWRAPLRWAGIAVLLPIAVDGFYPILPLRPSPSWLMASRVARWYGSSDVRKHYPYLLCNHMGFFYSLDISPSGYPMQDWNRKTILSVPSETMLIWDPLFGPQNANADRAVTLQEVRAAGWIEVAGADAVVNSVPGSNWHIFHSRDGGR